LEVPNRTRKVFGADGAKVSDLVALNKELESLIERVELDRIISFSKTASFLTESKMPPWRETRPDAVRKYSY